MTILLKSKLAKSASLPLRPLIHVKLYFFSHNPKTRAVINLRHRNTAAHSLAFFVMGLAAQAKGVDPLSDTVPGQ